MKRGYAKDHLQKEIKELLMYLTIQEKKLGSQARTPSEIETRVARLLYEVIRLMKPADALGQKIAERVRERFEKQPILVEDAKEIVFDIEAYLFPRIPADKKSEYYPQRLLDTRMRELEHELYQLRSNPALEKKVAKLEKELRKLRVTSAVSFETNEKVQRDMLKSYKEAEKRVFVIMPFASVFDDVWKGSIERACNSEDFGYLRVDKISLSSWITEDIVNYIEMADFVISDITGNNPNVMFELGWALAKKKKPIVVRQKDDISEVPFDVKGIRYISYVNSWSGIERLYRDICKFLKTTSGTVNEETTEKKTKKKKGKKSSKT